MAEIPDYKPNTKKYKEEQAQNQTEKKKVDKVISGTAKVKKKSDFRKFVDNFITEDVSSVKDYWIKDVLVPNIVDTIEDIVVGGIRTLLRGDSGRRDRRDGRSYSGSPSYVNYSRFSDRKDDRSRRNEPARRGYDQGSVVVNSRADAEAVIEQMDGIMDTYGMVSVADLYDLVGMSSNYTDNNYGWTNIRNAEPVRLRDGGWEIRMPKAIPIK